MASQCSSRCSRARTVAQQAPHIALGRRLAAGTTPLLLPPLLLPRRCQPRMGLSAATSRCRAAVCCCWCGWGEEGEREPHVCRGLGASGEFGGVLWLWRQCRSICESSGSARKPADARLCMEPLPVCRHGNAAVERSWALRSPAEITPCVCSVPGLSERHSTALAASDGAVRQLEAAVRPFGREVRASRWNLRCSLALQATTALPSPSPPPPAAAACSPSSLPFAVQRRAALLPLQPRVYTYPAAQRGPANRHDSAAAVWRRQRCGIWQRPGCSRRRRAGRQPEHCRGA